MTLDDLSALVRERYPQGAVYVGRYGMAHIVTVHATPPPDGRDRTPWRAVAHSRDVRFDRALASVAETLRRRAA